MHGSYLMFSLAQKDLINELSKFLWWAYKNNYGGYWRDGSVVKTIDCSSKGPWFNSQHPHECSQLSQTPVPGHQTPTAKHHCTFKRLTVIIIMETKIVRTDVKGQEYVILDNDMHQRTWF